MSDKKKMKENKKNYGFWLDPEINQLIDENVSAGNAHSRSDFVEKALRFYSKSLTGEGSDNSKLMQELKSFESHMAHILFKVAGEQAIVNLIISDQIVSNIDDAAMREYRNTAYNLVRKSKGAISFKDALDDARIIANYGYIEEDDNE